MARWGRATALASLACAAPWVEQTLAGALDRPCSSSARPCLRARDVDVEALGLRLSNVDGSYGSWRGRADAVVVRAGWNGLGVDVHRPAVTRATPAAPQASAPVASLTAAPRTPKPNTPPRLPNGGIPIRVRMQDPLVFEIDRHRARIHRAEVLVDRQGRVSAQVEADLRQGSNWVGTIGPMTLTPLEGWSTWGTDGVVQLADRRAIHLRATVSPQTLALQARTSDGGNIRAQGSRSGPWTLEAASFPLSTLATVWPSRLAAVKLDAATLTGHLDLAREGAWFVRARNVELAHVRLADPRVSKEPVELHPFTLDGQAQVRSAEAFDVELTARMGRLTTRFEASRQLDRWRATVDLAPIECQALLEDLPTAITEPLAGLELAGTIDGRVELDVALAELRTDAGTSGHWVFDIPIVQRCRVLQEPSRIDPVALVGPYRHHFVDGLGRPRTQILATGAPGYRTRSDVPLLASAFPALEDSQFWHHDGFDRTQIVRALWHNLRVGRIARGASTISQQTARNLFLGIDRSLARKVQEAALTHRLEAHVPKGRILEIYLNIIELGPGIHGVEEASQFYFGRPADQLTLLEALHLAALAPAPHRYAEQFANGKVDADWLTELRRHARRMVRRGTVDPAELARALATPLRLLDRTKATEPNAPTQTPANKRAPKLSDNRSQSKMR